MEHSIERANEPQNGSRHDKLFELLHQQNLMQTAQLKEKKQRIAARRKALIARKVQRGGDLSAKRDALRADFLQNAQTL